MWIKSLYIFYYEICGNDDNFNIDWKDDPKDWSKQGIDRGKRSIVIDAGTKEVVFMFKITVHISTDVLQIQVANKDTFTKGDLPKLK